MTVNGTANFNITIKIKYTKLLTASHKSLINTVRDRGPKTHSCGIAWSASKHDEQIQIHIPLIWRLVLCSCDCLLIKHHRNQFPKQTDDVDGILSRE
jgi:hypothetical protein